MKVLRWLDENFEKTICIFLFMVFASFMVLNVIMRFVFNNAIPWASEFVLFIAIWFIMFATSYGFKTGAHVKVEFLVGLLPEKAQKILTLIGDLLVLVFFVYLTIYGTVLLGDKSLIGKTGLLIPYPMWTLYAALPVGTFCSCFRILQNFLQTWRALKSREHGETPDTGLQH